MYEIIIGKDHPLYEEYKKIEKRLIEKLMVLTKEEDELGCYSRETLSEAINALKAWIKTVERLVVLAERELENMTEECI